MLNAQALADRYVAAWNEPDPIKRSSAIAALWRRTPRAAPGRRADMARSAGLAPDRRQGTTAGAAFAFAPPEARASAATS